MAKTFQVGTRFVDAYDRHYVVKNIEVSGGWNNPVVRFLIRLEAEERELNVTYENIALCTIL